MPQRRIIIIDVHKGTNHVLVVQVVKDDAPEGDFCPDTAVNDTSSAPNPDVKSGCLLGFHYLFAYLTYETIDRMTGVLSWTLTFGYIQSASLHAHKATVTKQLIAEGLRT